MAVIALIFLGYVILQGDPNMVDVIIWPIVSFASLAFGLDWKSKNDIIKTNNTEININNQSNT